MREPKDIKIGDYTLEEILERHLHWLNRDCENWESMQADLHNADLHGANLYCTDLRGANLHGANLYCTDLRGANLYGADLSDTDLRGANLCSAKMMGANLCSADLRGAKMMDADIRDTNMIDTNIIGADLRGANMIDADMRGANICNVDMRSADKLRKGIKLSEPIIGWKKCKNNVLVKLEIPRGAIVFSINNSKCRTDKAKVLEIIGSDRAYSNHKFFSYYVGDVIEVFNFNCEYNVECAKGIHFFKTREEAENY